MDQGLLVVLFGLVAALGWGAGDYVGGSLARRLPLFAVIIGIQVAGLLVAAVLFVVLQEEPPSPSDIGWTLATGAVGVFGVLTLYRGLAVGRMGVVAPTAGVLGAAVPVAVGLVLQAAPAPASIAGMVLAFVSVIVVTRAPGHEHDDRPTGIRWGLVAGVCIGVSFTTFAQVHYTSAFGVLVILRVVQISALLGMAVAIRRPWRVARSAWPQVLVAGAIDICANAAYITAAGSGPLAVAVVLSSLYPVVTVMLALGLLGERLTARHVAGVLLAAVAIVLIALGSVAA